MNIITAAEAIQDLIVANITTLNSNETLASSGLAFSAELAPANSKDSSPYRYIKVGDRGGIEVGLTVCIIPRIDRVLTRLTQYMAIHEVTICVAVYLKVVGDPQKAAAAQAGACEAMRTLLGKNHTLSNGDLANCKVGDQQFGGQGDSLGVITRVASIDWTAEYAASEA